MREGWKISATNVSSPHYTPVFVPVDADGQYDMEAALDACCMPKRQSCAAGAAAACGAGFTLKKTASACAHPDAATLSGSRRRYFQNVYMDVVQSLSIDYSVPPARVYGGTPPPVMKKVIHGMTKTECRSQINHNMGPYNAFTPEGGGFETNAAKVHYAMYDQFSCDCHVFGAFYQDSTTPLTLPFGHPGAALCTDCAWAWQERQCFETNFAAGPDAEPIPGVDADVLFCATSACSAEYDTDITGNQDNVTCCDPEPMATKVLESSLNMDGLTKVQAEHPTVKIAMGVAIRSTINIAGIVCIVTTITERSTRRLEEDIMGLLEGRQLQATPSPTPAPSTTLTVGFQIHVLGGDGGLSQSDALSSLDEVMDGDGTSDLSNTALQSAIKSELQDTSTYPDIPTTTVTAAGSLTTPALTDADGNAIGYSAQAICNEDACGGYSAANPYVLKAEVIFPAIYCTSFLCAVSSDRSKCCDLKQTCSDGSAAIGAANLCGAENTPKSDMSGLYCEGTTCDVTNAQNCCDPKASCMTHTCSSGTRKTTAVDLLCAGTVCAASDDSQCCDADTTGGDSGSVYAAILAVLLLLAE